MGCLGIPAGGRNGKAFWAIFINNGLKPLGNFRHGLLIGNFFPLVLTPRAHALQWGANPIRVIVDTRRRNALKTNIAWSIGLASSKKLLSSTQIERFIRTGNVTEELDAGPIIEQDVTRVTHAHAISDLIAKGRDLEKIVLANAVKLHADRKVMVFNNKTVIFS